MKKKWIKVYATTEIHQAELLKGMLEENAIECIIMNKKDSAYTVLGEIELFVTQANVVKSLHLINQSKL